MYSFTNRFSGPSLRERVLMMNSHRSHSSFWWRYGIWLLLMGTMVFACRHKTREYTEIYNESSYKGLRAPFPLTNLTRSLAAELEQEGLPWFRQSGLSVPDQLMIVNGRRVTVSALFNYPEILCLRDGHLALKLLNSQQAKIFVNAR